MTRSFEWIAARVLPLGLLTACQAEPTTPSGVRAFPGAATAAVVDDVVASLRVIPDSQMVFVGDRFQITARPKNQAGQVLDKSVRWTVTNTSVVSAVGSPQTTMSFTALRAGKTSVKATVDAKSRYSIVVVRRVAGAKVVVTPATATVATGATAQFVATGLTSTG